jgi:5-methyltetrahydropteroyltriglutamate--homocysteine methyltransferase
LQPIDRHPAAPDASFDGGELNCGNGLLLLIRKHIDPLAAGQLLEVKSTEISVEEDLPAWCRMTGNQLVSWTRRGNQRSFLVCKGPFDPRLAGRTASIPPKRVPDLPAAVPVEIPHVLPAPAAAVPVVPLSVMGIGSWPRPSWMLRAIHEHLEGRLSEQDFEATAQDAVRLAVDAQLRAPVDVVTDGEQRRDSYASFVGGLLDNCQLIPLSDLLPLVDDPDQFAMELDSLDVPAAEVRHPAVLGRLGRSRSLAVHELEFAKTLTSKPIKIALPGPYTLARTMWMECISDRAYRSREDLAQDIVRVLREEVHFLLAAGAPVVQFDEPVLTEVVHAGPKNTRSFMCGALSEKNDPTHELEFALSLIRGVVNGLPAERLAYHVCRGNWTRNESAALAGDYHPLLPVLSELPVGTVFLEFCTSRAGSMEILREIPTRLRVGVGVVNQKDAGVESVSEILARAEEAIRFLGAERVLLTPDCGFATFADNPITASTIAEAKLASIAEAARILKGESGSTR